MIFYVIASFDCVFFQVDEVSHKTEEVSVPL